MAMQLVIDNVKGFFMEAHPSSFHAVARSVPNQKSFSEKIWGTDVNRHSKTY